MRIFGLPSSQLDSAENQKKVEPAGVANDVLTGQSPVPGMGDFTCRAAGGVGSTASSASALLEAG